MIVFQLELDKQYPSYGFAQHKGYGVPAHVRAIFKEGYSPIHRRTFSPIKQMVLAREAAKRVKGRKTEAKRSLSSSFKAAAAGYSPGPNAITSQSIDNGRSKRKRSKRPRHVT